MLIASRNCVRALLVGLFAVHLAGCGSAPTTLERTASVSGIVTFAGQPVEEGTVELADVKVGGGGAGPLGPGGKYEIKGLLAGRYKVSIQPPVVEDKGDGKTAPRKVPKDVANIPAKYRNDATSGFTLDIVDGEAAEGNFKME